MRAALSLDLDNKWSYMKTHGDAGWESFPTYLPVVIPTALDVMKSLGSNITFLVVGQDAANEANRDVLAELGRNGHEVGNHSYHHEPWMSRRSEPEIDDEFARSEDAIEAATGHRTAGFRGPGFTQSDAIVRTLARRGYAYDASSLPTFIGPLARAYYFKTANLDAAALREREDLFGKFSDGFQPNRPHRIGTNGLSITEVPVTTMPGLRLPMHVSYVLYIATVSPALALAYFRTALALCKLTRTEPSILLHPLDFIGAREAPELAFFPAMNLDPALKREILLQCLQLLKRDFDVVTLREFATQRKDAPNAAIPGH